MSQNSAHSSHRSNSLSSTTPWACDSDYSGSAHYSCSLYDPPADPLHRGIILGLPVDQPVDLLGTADQPIEISSSVEGDPSEMLETPVHDVSMTSIRSEDYLTYSGSIEDVTDQLRQPGMMVVDPIEVSDESHSENPPNGVVPMYQSLSSYLYQLPPTPSAVDREPFQAVLQGTKTVYEYFKEFIHSPLADLCLERGDNELMVAFFRGLRPELQFLMGTREYLSLPEMYIHAKNEETELDSKRALRRYVRSFGTRGRNLKGPRNVRTRRRNQNGQRAATPPGLGNGANEEDGKGESGKNGDGKSGEDED